MSRRFLVVEDDPIVAKTFVTHISKHAPAVSVATLAEARVARRTEQYLGIVLDVRLPDGTGLDLLRELRAGGDRVPVLVATGHLDPSVVNTAHRLDAHCVFKPDLVVNLLRFVASAIAAQPTDSIVGDALREVAMEHQLAIREQQVLEHVSKGIAREDVPAAMGVSNNTVKTIIRGLLSKMEEHSVEAAARVVLERAIELARSEERRRRE